MPRGRPRKNPLDYTDTQVVGSEPVQKDEHIVPEVENGRVTKKEYSAIITKDYYSNIDPFYLSKKDPDFEYRFLRAEDKNLSIKTSDVLAQKGGWQICPREHLKRIGIQNDRMEKDGLYRKGDTVLAFMPKELYLEKERIKEEMRRSRTDAIKRMTKKGDPGVAGIGHKDMKGLQTQEQMRM